MSLIGRVSSRFPQVSSRFPGRPFHFFQIPNNSSSSSSSSTSAPRHGVHVFHCPDGVGIVAKLSECIASRGGNIQSVDVFVPDNKKDFYSRRYLRASILSKYENENWKPKVHSSNFVSWVDEVRNFVQSNLR